MSATKIITLIALTGTALMAGLFFGYSNSVLGTLERLPAGQGAAAMNVINVVIYNPLFLMIFSLTGLACLVIVILGFVRGGPIKWWLLIGSLLYFAAGMITMAVNVPLNEQLVALDPASPAGLAEWERFVAGWGPANTVRAIACTAAVIAFGIALAVRETPRPREPVPAGRFGGPGAVPRP